MRVAGRPSSPRGRRSRRDRPGVRRRVQHRREVGPAAEPRPGRHHQAGVHVHGRHIADCADGRSARCPRPRSAGLRRRRGSPCGIPARTRRCTVEQCTPTFSNTPPCISAITPPPPAHAEWSGALPGPAHEAARRPVARGKRRRQRRPRGCSKAAQISSRSASNQARAAAFLASMSGAGRCRSRQGPSRRREPRAGMRSRSRISAKALNGQALRACPGGARRQPFVARTIVSRGRRGEGGECAGLPQRLADHHAARRRR